MLCELAFLVSFIVTHATVELVTFMTFFVMAKILQPEHLVTTTDIALELFSMVHTGMRAQPRSILENLVTSFHFTLVLPFLVLVGEMGAHTVDSVKRTLTITHLAQKLVVHQEQMRPQLCTRFEIGVTHIALVLSVGSINFALTENAVQFIL